MGHPASMPTRPTNPSMSGSDLAVSIAALDPILAIVAAVFGMFSLAFLDHGPPES